MWSARNQGPHPVLPVAVPFRSKPARLLRLNNQPAHEAVAARALRPYSGPMKRTLLIVIAILAVVLALLVAYVWRGNPSERPIEDTMGTDPVLAEPEARSIPSISLARSVGWKDDEAPEATGSLKVGRFATGLVHPRTMLTLPNGDVLVAETSAPPRELGGFSGFVMKRLMNYVGAGVPSPDRITLLRDADGDGKAEARFTLREEGLASPSGMAFGGGKLYIANHDAVLAFDFEPGATRLDGEPQKLMDLPPAGNHWMRNLLLNEDEDELFVAVGSASNIAENGMEAEQGRAAIWEIDLESGSRRQFANGMRNPNGMAWNPSTGEFWATVQERDMLGPDLVPDYLTNVPVGVQYGWPWVYWKDVFDERVENPMPMYMLEYTRRPEYALGAHVSALGMVFSTGGNILGDGYANGAFIARHGSWNRKPAAGYDVIFVPFDARGNPQDEHKTVIEGFLGEDGAKGRPTWLAWDSRGALLVSDDVAGVVWRVMSPGAKPSQPPKPVVERSLPPQRELDATIDRKFKATISDDYIVDPDTQ